MPSYELALVVKKLAKPDLVAALKRACGQIYKNDGLLFEIQNMGTRPLPFRVRSHKSWNTEASYFLVKFDAAAKVPAVLVDEYERDVDFLRWAFTRIEEKPKVECTLEEESQPPAYRADVKKMMATGKKKETRYDAKTGLSYNPFTT